MEGTHGHTTVSYGDEQPFVPADDREAVGDVKTNGRISITGQQSNVGAGGVDYGPSE